MKMDMKFLACEHCGNMVAFVKDKGVPILCCGTQMNELIPGSVDAATEKHIPVVTITGNCVEVKVGSTAHPMTDAHYIEWIGLQTKHGNQRVGLSPTDEPCASFCLCEPDEVVAAFAYCNLHGLWKS